MVDRTSISGTVLRFDREKPARDDDKLALEEPLEIRFGRVSLAVTMRTPGNDIELATGFLLGEGVIRSIDDVEKITAPGRNSPNVVSVIARRGFSYDRDRLQRNFRIHSSCGLCGKTTLQALQVKSKPIATDLKLPVELTYALPQMLRDEQETFDETGGLHAAAVFDRSGKLLWAREDVGRHNAVDKVIGAAARAKQVPLDQHILMVSGRASFEIMQKALAARIPVVAAISAPSSLAVALARKFKMTLIGFLRGHSCNVYAGEERVVLQPECAKNGLF